MKIAFLHYSYPGIGGTETVTNLLGRFFKKNGHQVVVISWKESEIGETEFPVFQMPDPSSIDSEANNNWLAETVEKEKIDVVVNQGPFWHGSDKVRELAVVVSVLHYAPSFRIDNSVAAIEQIYENRRKLPFARRVVASVRYVAKNIFARLDFERFEKKQIRKIWSNSDRMIVITDGYVSELEHLLDAEGRIESITNPVVLSGIPSIEVGGKENLVLFIGRLTKWDKRPDRLLRIWEKASKEVSGWTLSFLGDGEERERLELSAKQLGLDNVTFEGFVDVEPYLKRASILAMTSQSEGLPMVILEAFQHGVVPIAFNCSAGVASLIDNGVDGYLIDGFDEDLYARRLAGLMRDRRLAEEMARNSAPKLKRHSIETIGPKWIELFNRLKEENK